jgi:signal transduction histidine kinase
VNLLGNAVKFSPVGGTITVGLRGAARAVLITISDSGAGIPSVDQQRIFERFYRAPRETGDPTIRGSGLGLAIVKAIVTQHGGTIDVESHPGQGATFTVRLPLAAGPGGAGGPAASPDVAGAAVRPQRDDTVVRGGALTAASTRTDGGRH